MYFICQYYLDQICIRKTDQRGEDSQLASQRASDREREREKERERERELVLSFSQSTKLFQGVMQIHNLFISFACKSGKRGGGGDGGTRMHDSLSRTPPPVRNKHPKWNVRTPITTHNAPEHNTNMSLSTINSSLYTVQLNSNTATTWRTLVNTMYTCVSLPSVRPWTN